MPITTQNWDAVTPPTLPAGWARDSGASIVTLAEVTAPSSPNVLRLLDSGSAPGSVSTCYYNTQDGNSGNVIVTSDFLIPGGGGGGVLVVFGRATAHPEDWSQIVCYQVELTPTAVVLARQNNGTRTQIVSVSATIAVGHWYKLILTLNGTALSVDIQDLTDNKWLDSGGTFQSGGQQSCISTTDGNISGQGYAGLAGFAPSLAFPMAWDDFELDAIASSSFTIAPTTIPKNHSGNITLTLNGSGTTWAGGGSEFSLSGVTGVTKVSENVTSATAATVVVTTDATHTGTLTITDLDSITATTTVATASLVISPTSGQVSTTPTLTLTGTNTVWTQETASTLFSVTGGTSPSIATPTITTDTAGTAVLTVGSGTGSLTITDNSTGATATFTATRAPTTYYVASGGSDSANGTSTGTPWQTIGKVNTNGFVPGDTVNFNGGDTFSDAALTIDTVAGTKALPVTIQSYGTGIATLSQGAGTHRAVWIKDSSYITVQNLAIAGPGVSSAGTVTGGNTSRMPAVDIQNTQGSSTAISHIRLLNCTVSGAYAGVWVHSTASSSPGPINNVEIGNCDIHDCLYFGVWTSGSEATSGQVGTIFYLSKTPLHQCFHMHDCYVYNIYGGTVTGYSIGFAGQTLTGGDLPSGAPDTDDDSRVLNGVGVLLGNLKGSTVEFCEIHHTGLNNLASTGGGPANSWSYETDRLVYQFIESHHAQCGAGIDGVGLDFDGGTTNCICQYCYTHNNAGAGLLTGSVSGSSVATSVNTFRYCVSEDDGITDTRQGSFWAFTDVDYTVVHDCTFYSHTTGAKGCFRMAGGTGNLAMNNVFVSEGQNLVDKGGSTGWTLLGNLYHNYSNSFNISWNSVDYASLTAWQLATSQDALGVSADPLLTDPNGGGTISNLRGMNALLTAYKISSISPCIDAGANLPALATPVVTGPRDFYGNPSLSDAGYDIGANEYTSVVTPGGGGGANRASLPSGLSAMG